MIGAVPLVDLHAQWAEVAGDVHAGWRRVLANTAYIGGQTVAEFEAAYAAYLGVAHCIGVGNGTDAIELALRAVGVRPGDEAIVPTNTFIATAEAVVRAGATPVFVDVDPEHLLIDPARVAEAITPRTRVIVPVHLFGQTAPVEALLPLAEECGAVLVEDAAQAHGATRFGRRAGSLGTIAATSFYPGKNLGAAGDAGAVLTDDPALARRVRLLGAHGSQQKYVHETLGFNSRMDALQAVVLSAKLRRLDRWNQARRAAADRYGTALRALPAVAAPSSAAGNSDAWHLYVIQVAHRDQSLARLNAAGIGAGIHYPTPLHLTKPFAAPEHRRGRFPVAERAADRILSLPLYPHITPALQQRVIDELTGALTDG